VVHVALAAAREPGNCAQPNDDRAPQPLNDIEKQLIRLGWRPDCVIDDDDIARGESRGSLVDGTSRSVAAGRSVASSWVTSNTGDHGRRYARCSEVSGEGVRK
jgi:hypothetical protein